MSLKGNLVLSYQLARSLNFTVQQFSLPLFESLLMGENRFKKVENPELTKKLFQELFQFLKEDSENIAAGIYPVEVLKPENPKNHFLRYPKIIWDGMSLWRRRSKQKSKEFTEQAQEFLKDMPEYFRRNFHFQTDGYLSPTSAELYDHQVDILFSGAADAMRRLMIPLLRRTELDPSGEGLNFIEVGAGTGRLTRFMGLSFPKAKIVATDLSHHYLKKAQMILQSNPRVDFVQAPAESLSYKDGTFDLHYSCFLFHELPLEVRREVLAEAFRVLKPGGYFAFVDSMQKGEAKEKSILFDKFPVEFHEPFFKNYTLHSMEGLLGEQGFEIVETRIGFLAKSVVARKKA